MIQGRFLDTRACGLLSELAPPVVYSDFFHGCRVSGSQDSDAFF